MCQPFRSLHAIGEQVCPEEVKIFRELRFKFRQILRLEARACRCSDGGEGFEVYQGSVWGHDANFPFDVLKTAEDRHVSALGKSSMLWWKRRLLQSRPFSSIDIRSVMPTQNRSCGSVR